MTQITELAGDHVFTTAVAGNATAATEDEFVLLVAPHRMRVTAVKWVPTANITADGTDYFTVTVRNRKAAGSGTAVVAQRSYDSGNGTAFVAESMTLSDTEADLEVAAGDVLTAEKLAEGSGLAMPDGLIQIHAQVA